MAANGVPPTIAALEGERDLFKGRYERRAKLISSINTALYHEVCSLRQLVARRDGFEYVASTWSLGPLLELLDGEPSGAAAGPRLHRWLREEYARELLNIERFYKQQLHAAKTKLRAKDEELLMRSHDPMVIGDEATGGKRLQICLTETEVKRLQEELRALTKGSEGKAELIKALHEENRQLQAGLTELRELLRLAIPAAMKYVGTVVNP
jgi:hypothetical protein